MTTPNLPLDPQDMEHVVSSLADTVGALAQALPATPENGALHERARQAAQMAQTTIALLLNPAASL